MRILHLNQYSSRRGGIESYIAEVAVALQTYGHEAPLIAFAPEDAGESILTTTFAPAPDWPSPIDAAADVFDNVIAKFRPDVAYLHGVYHPGIVNLIAGRLPTVAYVHAPYVVCPGSAQYLYRRAAICPHRAGLICLLNAQTENCCWGHNPIKHIQFLSRVKSFTHAYEQVGAVLVGSGFMRQLLMRGGISADQISILPPVLLEESAVSTPDAGHSRTVLYVGRLVREKGLRQLIEALASIEAEWDLIVAGDGPDRETCETLAAQKGIADRVRFVGWRSASEIDTLYNHCACVALPSLWPEPFGRVGPEAFSHGRPVVAYDSGGVSSWLDHGVSGYLVPYGNIALLRDGLQALLNSASLRRQMGQHAREKALSEWSVQAHIQRLLDVFHRVQ